MKKKGFTLIELLGVIIVLSVIALITVPLVLDVVDEARIQANTATANGYLEAAKLYKTESIFDSSKQNDIEYVNNIYSKIIVKGNKPENGELYINKNGESALAVVLDGKCYYKAFYQELTIKEEGECSLGWVGVDEEIPTLTAKTEEVVIKKGTSVDVTSYFNQPTYGPSGGTLTCDITDISLLEPGEHTITCTATGSNGKTVTATKTINVLYIEEVLNGADPELDSGMIPIEITTDGIIKKADLKSEWYNYTDKKWANAVLVSNETRQTYQTAEAGTTISTGDIKAYYVWIPRYKYQIFTDVDNIQETASLEDSSQYKNKAQIINVVFENKTTTKSTGTSKDSWLTHPAFTFGLEELNGIWVGKFETTGTADAPTVLGYDSRYTVTNNITSLREQNVSEQFLTSQKINYGLTTLEASMLKNMEWGAIAYLTASNYGQGKTEVMINNSSVYNTGCAASDYPTTDYGGYSGYAGCENEWYSSLGQKASTTGNIYGIYDMSGGAWDYVMGVMEDSLGSGVPASGRNNDSNSGFTGKLTNPSTGSDSSMTSITGETFPNKKYFDMYNYGESNVVYAGRGYLGDATYELDGFSKWMATDGNGRYHSGWNQDYAYFVDYDYPWFRRGGDWYLGTSAGVFAFAHGYGSAYDSVSFRSVLR